jgi:hypothetical protein
MWTSRKIYNSEELNGFHTSRNIMIIKSRKTKGVGNITRTKEMRNAYKVMVGNPEGKRQKDTDTHRKIILK